MDYPISRFRSDLIAIIFITAFLCFLNYILAGFIGMYFFGGLLVFISNFFCNHLDCWGTYEIIGEILFFIFTPIIFYFFRMILFNKESTFYIKSKKGKILVFALIILLILNFFSMFALASVV